VKLLCTGARAWVDSALKIRAIREACSASMLEPIRCDEPADQKVRFESGLLVFDWCKLNLEYLPDETFVRVSEQLQNELRDYDASVFGHVGVKLLP
jgi:hypothetical protein